LSQVKRLVNDWCNSFAFLARQPQFSGKWLGLARHCLAQAALIGKILFALNHSVKFKP